MRLHQFDILETNYTANRKSANNLEILDEMKKNILVWMENFVCIKFHERNMDKRCPFRELFKGTSSQC